MATTENTNTEREAAFSKELADTAMRFVDRAGRAFLSLPAAGQEPVAYRYKDARGHWRYVGAPLTKGWGFPQNLNHEPLYAAPQPAAALAAAPKE